MMCYWSRAFRFAWSICTAFNPSNRDELIASARAAGGFVVTVEDHYAHGGIGDVVFQALAGEPIRGHKLASGLLKKQRDCNMADTTVTKINSRYSPGGEQGQTYLASGKSVSMRLWQESPREHDADLSKREYETAGYVISGHAELEVEGQKVKLEPGDSWIVPKGAGHRYHIVDEFTAIEATAPPAHVHGRDL